MASDTDDPTKRGPGRPKGDAPGASVSTWLRPDDHDRLIKLANQREMSVSSLVRQLLASRLK